MPEWPILRKSHTFPSSSSGKALFRNWKMTTDHRTFPHSGQKFFLLAVSTSYILAASSSLDFCARDESSFSFFLSLSLTIAAALVLIIRNPLAAMCVRYVGHHAEEEQDQAEEHGVPSPDVIGLLLLAAAFFQTLGDDEGITPLGRIRRVRAPLLHLVHGVVPTYSTHTYAPSFHTRAKSLSVQTLAPPLA